MKLLSRRARWTIAALTILAAAAIGTEVAVFKKATSYGGRRVQSWAKLLWAGSPSDQDNATKALRHLGTNAAPELGKMLRKKDGILRTRFLDLMEKQKLIRYPYMDRDIDQQRIALKAIGALGQSAEPLLPILQDIIRNWRNESVDVTQEAIKISKVLSPDSTPTLILGSGPPRLIYPEAASHQ